MPVQDGIRQGTRSLTGAPDNFAAINRDTAPISCGQPVATYTTGDGVVLADATDAAKECVGLAAGYAAPGDEVDVQTAGMLFLGDWTAVTGAATLPARGTMFLSDTPGQLTTVAPSAQGHCAQMVGKVISAHVLKVRIEPEILL